MGTPTLNFKRNVCKGTPKLNLKESICQGTPKLNLIENVCQGTPKLNLRKELREQLGIGFKCILISAMVFSKLNHRGNVCLKDYGTPKLNLKVSEILKYMRAQ